MFLILRISLSYYTFTSASPFVFNYSSRPSYLSTHLSYTSLITIPSLLLSLLNNVLTNAIALVGLVAPH